MFCVQPLDKIRIKNDSTSHAILAATDKFVTEGTSYSTNRFSATIATWVKFKQSILYDPRDTSGDIHVTSGLDSTTIKEHVGLQLTLSLSKQQAYRLFRYFCKLSANLLALYCSTGIDLLELSVDGMYSTIRSKALWPLSAELRRGSLVDPFVLCFI